MPNHDRFTSNFDIAFTSEFSSPRCLRSKPIGENFRKCYSALVAACIVSFVDIEGLRHSVEVEAETLYEAAVLAIRTFKQHHCEPAEMSKLEVEIRSSITHTVTLKKIHSWLQGGARSPKEAVTKERLRAMINQ